MIYPYFVVAPFFESGAHMVWEERKRRNKKMGNYQNTDSRYDGCDLILPLPARTAPLRLLQLTDMQVINAALRRTPGRLQANEIAAWSPHSFDAMCGNHIRSLVAQTKPDLIFITGDITYGSFDDDGSSLTWFCQLMDSFAIPWAPVFGNHDNESAMGVAWQCELFEKSRYCLFARGNVTGNGNYTIGITVGGELTYALHMLDSHGCLRGEGLMPDQLALVRDHAARMQAACGHCVPALLAYHSPTAEFAVAERAKGYAAGDDTMYTIGVDTPAADGDFGCRFERLPMPQPTIPPDSLFTLASDYGINAVCVGHCHNINTCITYRGIRLVFGLKTGQYDYHIPGQVGGTLLHIGDGLPEVTHVQVLSLRPKQKGHLFQNDQDMGL